MPTALIAEDEPLLAAALQAELAAVWPDLTVVATATHGHQAVALTLQHLPDVLFFDIRMPGQSGLEAAAELADAWPDHSAKPFPALVFVTAYDQYALAAFDTLAVDYLVKPVQRHRLEKCKEKITSSHIYKEQTATKKETSIPSQQQLDQLTALLTHWQQVGAASPTLPTAPLQAPAHPQPERLRVIQASHNTSQGNDLVLIPVEQVLVLEAADKYLRVLTATQEWLIRTPLKELLPQLDPDRFWQIHRGTVVQASAISRISRDEAGRQWLHLHQRPERWAISRLYAHRFKAM